MSPACQKSAATPCATPIRTTSRRFETRSSCCCAIRSSASGWLKPGRRAHGCSAGSARRARRWHSSRPQLCPLLDERDHDVPRGEQAGEEGSLVVALCGGRAVDERLDEVVPRLPAVAMENDAGGRQLREVVVEVIAAAAEAPVRGEELQCLDREAAPMRRVDVDGGGREVRRLHVDLASRLEDAMTLAQHAD